MVELSQPISKQPEKPEDVLYKDYPSAANENEIAMAEASAMRQSTFYFIFFFSRNTFVR